MTDQERAEFNKSLDETFAHFGLTADDGFVNEPTHTEAKKTTIIEHFEAEDGSAIYVERTVETPNEVKMVSEDDNEIVVDGITFIVSFPQTIHGGIELEISGGYAADDDGEMWEIDGNYHIRTLYENADFVDKTSQEIEVAITAEDVAKAKAYRANYPESID